MAGRAVARLQSPYGNMVLTATHMLSDGRCSSCSRKQDRGWLERAPCILLPGPPGMTGGRTGKHKLSFPACFSARSSESPLGNCQQTPPEHLETSLGCPDRASEQVCRRGRPDFLLREASCGVSWGREDGTVSSCLLLIISSRGFWEISALHSLQEPPSPGKDGGAGKREDI